MTYFKAIANEPKELNYNRIIAQTKTPNGKFSSMDRTDFERAVRKHNWESFRIEKID